MQDNGRMLRKVEIATKTGLSRQTIRKHLKEYYSYPQYLIEMKQFRFMSLKILAKVFKFAVNQVIKAAKLYFDNVGGVNSQHKNEILIRQQNNYIQINGTVLSQNSIKHLSPARLNQVETRLKTVLPQ